MIDITASVQEAIKKLNRLPRALEQAALPAFKKSADQIKRIMARPGLPVTYPIHWDSLKQKIFVILKLKEEDNLPYTRIDWRVKGWKVTQISNGYSVGNLGNKIVFLNGTVTGTLPSAVHVQPTGQSNIFAGRWRLFRPVLNAVLARLPENILKEIHIDANQ